MRANNSVDRAGFAAMNAADAGGLINDGDGWQYRLGKWQDLLAEQFSQPFDRFLPARGAQVNFSAGIDNGLRVGPATRETALCTLRLRQQVIDCFDQVVAVRRQ